MNFKYAVSRNTQDCFPVEMRMDCDCTRETMFKKSQGLQELMEEYDKLGYDIVGYQEMLRLKEEKMIKRIFNLK